MTRQEKVTLRVIAAPRNEWGIRSGAPADRREEKAPGGRRKGAEPAWKEPAGGGRLKGESPLSEKRKVQQEKVTLRVVATPRNKWGIRSGAVLKKCQGASLERVKAAHGRAGGGVKAPR
jgi:hypothetical protein